MAKKNYTTTKTLSFLKDNVLNVTELTRTNRLSEILNMYAGDETSEVFVIQNAKKRNAVGVLLDLEYFERLLRLQEVFEKAADDVLIKTIRERFEKGEI